MNPGSITANRSPVYVCAKGHEGTTEGGFGASALLVQFASDFASVGPICTRCVLEDLAARCPMTRKDGP